VTQNLCRAVRWRITRGLTLLLAGAISTVAVSWACATWSPTRPHMAFRTRAPALWMDASPTHPRRQTTYQCSATSPGRRQTLQVDEDMAHGIWILVTSDTGLPWPALRSYLEQNPRETFTKRTGLHNPASSWDPTKASWVGEPVRDLPRQPLWPCFVFDTLFYAAIAWSIWQIPIILLSRRRAAANHCPRCAYDLRGLAPSTPCPECGATHATTSQPRSGARPLPGAEAPGTPPP
jgi:hypothetical protein